MARLSFRALVAFVTLGSLLALASTAQAQLCGGSHLYYILRDANGTPVSAGAGAKLFTVQGGMQASSLDTFRGYAYDPYAAFAPTMPADLVSALKGIDPLPAASAYCIFTKPVPLRVTMSGKTMDLVFNIVGQCCNSSQNFLVDGLPFQEGRFEITLAATGGPVPQSERSNFYPAKGWTKK